MIIPQLEIGTESVHHALDQRDHGIGPDESFQDLEDSMIAYAIGEDGERS
jgi:hypothetical protein